MKYRNLGKSGLMVSEIGLGGNNFGGRIDKHQSISVIHRALDHGVNFIDTADMYNEGNSEEIVGKAVIGRRDEIIISTKTGLPNGKLPNERGASRYHIMQSIEASLKRLDTDYIDLYYIHAPDPTTPIEETLRTLDDLVRTGKVRYLGCSNFNSWQLCEAQWTSRMLNLESFVVVESQYNIIQRGIELELVPCCQNYGIGVIPWGPLAGGFLTGKYRRGKPAPTGSRLTTQQSVSRSRLLPGTTTIAPAGPATSMPILTKDVYDRLEKLQEFSKEQGYTVGELAISWLLSHPWLSSVIAGATKPDQVSANITASDWRLTEDEIVYIDSL